MERSGAARIRDLFAGADETLARADEGRHAVGNMIISIQTLMTIIELQQQQIADLTARLDQHERRITTIVETYH
jgi:hypothetical protein